MKKIFTVIGAVTLLASCNNTPKGFTITGETKGIADGSKVYIEQIDPTTGQPNAVDSTDVKNNSFTFKGDAKHPDLNLIHFADGEGRVPVIVENGNIKVVFDKENTENNKATGTTNNDEFVSFSEKSTEIDKKIMAFQEENQEIYMKAKEENDEAKLDEIMDKLYALYDKKDNFVEEYLEKNPKSFTTLFIVTQQAPNGGISKEEALEYYNNFDEHLKQSKIGMALKTTLDQIPDAKIKVGDKAPDFSAKTPTGTDLSLNESLGKVTIIDFWASWCGPCRKENPKVVALYNQYHDKGLNIIGVSLDKEDSKWKEAIEKDQLTWNHVSNLMFWQDPIAQEYEVRAIPATFILDENGIVVAKNLRGKKLENKIKELLSK